MASSDEIADVLRSDVRFIRALSPKDVNETALALLVKLVLSKVALIGHISNTSKKRVMKVQKDIQDMAAAARFPSAEGNTINPSEDSDSGSSSSAPSDHPLPVDFPHCINLEGIKRFFPAQFVDEKILATLDHGKWFDCVLLDGCITLGTWGKIQSGLRLLPCSHIPSMTSDFEEWNPSIEIPSETSTTTIFPLNIEQVHWVLAMVDTSGRAFIYDPWKGDEYYNTASQGLLKFLRDLSPEKNWSVQRLRGPVQEDNHSCGPFVAAAAVHFLCEDAPISDARLNMDVWDPISYGRQQRAKFARLLHKHSQRPVADSNEQNSPDSNSGSQQKAAADMDKEKVPQLQPVATKDKTRPPKKTQLSDSRVNSSDDDSDSDPAPGVCSSTTGSVDESGATVSASKVNSTSRAYSSALASRGSTIRPNLACDLDFQDMAAAKGKEKAPPSQPAAAKDNSSGDTEDDRASQDNTEDDREQRSSYARKAPRKTPVNCVPVSDDSDDDDMASQSLKNTTRSEDDRASQDSNSSSQQDGMPSQPTVSPAPNDKASSRTSSSAPADTLINGNGSDEGPLVRRLKAFTAKDLALKLQKIGHPLSESSQAAPEGPEQEPEPFRELRRAFDFLIEREDCPALKMMKLVCRTLFIRTRVQAAKNCMNLGKSSHQERCDCLECAAWSNMEKNTKQGYGKDSAILDALVEEFKGTTVAHEWRDSNHRCMANKLSDSEIPNGALVLISAAFKKSDLRNAKKDHYNELAQYIQQSGDFERLGTLFMETIGGIDGLYHQPTIASTCNHWLGSQYADSDPDATSRNLLDSSSDLLRDLKKVRTYRTVEAMFDIRGDPAMTELARERVSDWLTLSSADRSGSLATELLNTLISPAYGNYLPLFRERSILHAIQSSDNVDYQRIILGFMSHNGILDESSEDELAGSIANHPYADALLVRLAQEGKADKGRYTFFCTHVYDPFRSAVCDESYSVAEKIKGKIMDDSNNPTNIEGKLRELDSDDRDAFVVWVWKHYLAHNEAKVWNHDGHGIALLAAPRKRRHSTKTRCTKRAKLTAP